MSWSEALKAFIPSVDLSNRKEACINIKNKLLELDSNNDYLVIIYDPISGPTNHGMTNRNYNSYLRIEGRNTKANVVVLWSEKGAREGATCDINREILDELSNGFSTDNLKRIAAKEGRIAQEIDNMVGQIEYTSIFGYVDDEISLKNIITIWEENSEGKSLWACKTKRGAHCASTNDERFIWIDGDEFTMAAMK